MTNKVKGQIRRGMASMRSNVVFDRLDGTVYVQFNWDTESFEFGTATNTGMIVDYVVPYDVDESFESNLSRAVLMAEDYLGKKTKTKTKTKQGRNKRMKELLSKAVRDTARCLCDRMSVLKGRAMNACERGQELRFSVLMSKVDKMANDLVAVCAAGSALGMTRSELMPGGAE